VLPNKISKTRPIQENCTKIFVHYLMIYGFYIFRDVFLRSPMLVRLSCQFSPCVFPPTLLCSPPQHIHAGNLVLICPKHFLIPCSPVKSLPNFRELLRLFLF